MTDVDTTQGETSPAGDQPPVTEADMISRGKGVKLDAIQDGTPAADAVEDFRKIVERYAEAESALEQLKDERNQAIRTLKDDHNVSFSALGEIMGNTSSLVLYMYQRAQGLSAKEIREISERSRLAKEQFREANPDAKPARKQTPEEKAFRKQQKEALAAFLAEQQAAGGDAPETDGEDADE